MPRLGPAYKGQNGAAFRAVDDGRQRRVTWTIQDRHRLPDLVTCPVCDEPVPVRRSDYCFASHALVSDNGSGRMPCRGSYMDVPSEDG